MQKYDIMGMIGEGAYGVVLKCKSNEKQEFVAIKKFKQTEDDQIVRKTTMREVKILKMLKHPNVVELRQAFRKRGIVYLVFQYVPNNLLEVLEKTPDGLEQEFIRVIIYQLLKGLAHLHSLNIIHRDIKPENLLIGDKKQLKICDFGFARLLKKSNEELTDYVATRWYRPPELLVGARYSKQIDIWAVGCIFGELIDGNPMFPGENQLDQLFLIQKCLGPLTPDHYETFLKNPRYLGMKFPDINNLDSIEKRYVGKLTSKAMNFLKQLLKMNPADRPTAMDAIKHPYFDGIRDEDIDRKLSSNIYSKNQSKIMQSSKQECPSTVHNDRKKYATNVYNPPLHSNQQRDRTQESQIYSGKNGNLKLQMSKKSKQEIIKQPNKNHIQNSKSISKNSTTNNSKMGKFRKQHEKHISLQKHAHRDLVTKTQTGFYIMGGGIIHEREDEEDNTNGAQYARNKIYNVKSPKSKQQQRRTNVANTEEIQEEEDEGAWQSTGQLPHLMMASQNRPSDLKNKSNQKMNIVITNSTFNYRNHY